MMKPHLLPLLLLLIVPSAGAAPPDTTWNLPPWTQPSSWDIELAPQDEPGPRFIMSGRLIGPDTLPVPHANLYVYHADSSGYYARRNQRFNRIAGVLRTNDRGEYRIRSILPGLYAGPGHVHFEVWEDGRPKLGQWVALYAAPGVPPIPGWTHTRSATSESGPHMALITLDSSGVYQCRHDLLVGPMMPLPASYDSLLQAWRRQYEKRHER